MKNLTEEEKLKLIRSTINTTNIRNRQRKKMSYDFLNNIINVYDNKYEETNRDRENDEKMEEIYEQRRKVNPLKKFIKANRNKYKTNEEFFEKNRAFFRNNKLYDCSGLIQLVFEIEQEEKEEKEMKEKIKKERDEKIKKDKEKRLKELREKKQKLNKIINTNNFSINSNNDKKFTIENLEKFTCPSKYSKIFKDSILKQESNLNNLNIQNSKNYSTILKNCNKTIEFNFIPNKKEYMNNKIKLYTIENSNKSQFICIQKLKYIENELVKSSNIINIAYIKHKVKKENIVENGLSLDDLRIVKKPKNKKILNVEKVKKIIEKIENENIMNKIIKEMDVPIHFMFCINCYECFNTNEINNHKTHFLFKIDNFKNEDDLDYNERLNIIYSILKKIQKKIILNRDKKLIKYYGKLLFHLYDIINNNNCYEDLLLSIININENYLNEYKLGTFQGVFRDLFLLFCQKISKIAFLKSNELNFSELNEGNDINNELDEDLNFFLTIEDKIKNNKN